MPPTETPMKIAVVGCGVAGLTAAWLLNRRHQVELFEKNDYVGGHTRTLTIPDGPDAGTPVDTGFIVMNHRNYPLFTRVLEQLGVALDDSSMSFSYYDRESGYGYAGNGLRGLLPHPAYLLKRPHLQLMRDLWRFARTGYRDLLEGRLSGKCLGEYLGQRGFSKAFQLNYLYPMGAAIWSSPIAEMAAFPAEPYLHFLENHGLLRLTNRPQWRYVKGGSRTYLRAMLDTFDRPPRLQAAPQRIRRTADGVLLEMPSGERLAYDHVVIGAHADEALKLLADPDDEERRNLGAWRYQDNTVVLHTHADATMPPDPRLWSSWNFVRAPGQSTGRPVSVSYHMNRLQRLPARHDYFVTLNPETEIPDGRIIDRTTLTHPLYGFEAMASQPRLAAANGRRNTWLCGSYFGYGFHEDAVRSAVDVARAFDIEL